ncbi:hypothetical protein PV768_18955 [Pseudarthrobacter sp. CC4]|uniref:hypothetical protein n=1 Tax=Pseudarthrobacter sp. CC4 TaxID=3029190 RepID=UPI003B8C4E50
MQIDGLGGEGPNWNYARMAKFQRFQSDYVGRTGAFVGIFVAVDHLRRTGRLSENEITLYATARLQPLLEILDAKSVFWECETSADPGEIVYEDQWQVGVIPSSRLAMTPLPYPGKPGPNDWFEVRERYLPGYRTRP